MHRTTRLFGTGILAAATAFALTFMGASVAAADTSAGSTSAAAAENPRSSAAPSDESGGAPTATDPRTDAASETSRPPGDSDDEDVATSAATDVDTTSEAEEDDGDPVESPPDTDKVDAESNTSEADAAAEGREAAAGMSSESPSAGSHEPVLPRTEPDAEVRPVVSRNDEPARGVDEAAGKTDSLSESFRPNVDAAQSVSVNVQSANGSAATSKAVRGVDYGDTSSAALAVPPPTFIDRHPVVVVVSALMRVFGLVPTATWDPTLPEDIPVAWAVLAWTRRQIEHTFFNRSPVATQSEPVIDEATGEASGQITGLDADGDPLRYRVVRGPGGGTVTIDDSGSYTYTPTAAHLLTGGVDSFVIGVGDTGRHLHLFNGAGEATLTVSIFTPPQADTSTGSGATRGFNVYNLSSRPLTLLRTTGDKPDSAPPIGTVVQPGQFAHFELTYHFFHSDHVGAFFQDMTVPGPEGAYYWANMAVEGTVANSVSCSAKAGVTCGPLTPTSASTIRLFDAPGTVIEIGPGKGQEQAKVLNGLCYEGSDASCVFTATSQEDIYTDRKQFGSAVKNHGITEMVRSITVSETVTYTNSIQISAKASAKVFNLVNLELSATFGHTWTRSETFTEALQIRIPPGYESRVYSESPLYRDYGDFTLVMGNTTWILHDVYFDSPNPTGNPVYDVVDRPIPAYSAA